MSKAVTKSKDTKPIAPTEIHLWSARTNSPNPWLLVKMRTEEGERFRAIYWSLKRREFMVSTVTYISVQAFIDSRKADQKISSAGVPLRQAILDGWMPDILSGS